MEVISAAQNIQLHSFPDLNTHSKYAEANQSGSYDFQFFRKNVLFIASNPDQPIEYLTKKTASDKGEITFVRRLRLEQVNCVACPKSVGDDIAIGLSTGYIKTYHYKTNAEVNKYRPSSLNNGVIGLDFNESDEFLASVHENGVVNIYGQKTSVQLDAITFDKETTHAKFHPLKKLLLGMVSYNGSVTLYDIQAKRKVFQSSVHKSPCSDLAMSTANENCLITVGYDKMINLFDTRKKITSIQMSALHPLSAVALSACGSYICVGNLKGQLLGYDFRNVKEPLIVTKNVHNSSVKRITFLPDGKNTSMSFNDQHLENAEPVNRRDSVSNFFDYHYKRLPEEKRDFSRLFSVGNFSTRISLGHDLKMPLEEIPCVESESNCSSSSSSSSDVEFVGYVDNQTSFNKHLPTSFKREPKSSEASEAASNSRSSNIQYVAADQSKNLDQNNASAKLTSTPLNVQQGPGSLVSTPIAKPANPKLVITEVDAGDGVHLNAGEAVTREELQEKISWMEKQMSFQMENMKWDITNTNMTMFNQQMMAIERLEKNVQRLTACVDCLMHSDHFMKEFFELRLQNEELKSQLNKT